MQGVTYVSHQAALRSVERSVDDPLSTDAVNVHGTLHVLMAARDSGGEARRLRVVVVGLRRHPALPKVEDQTPAPISPYAVSKLAAEHYCRVFSKLYGLETVSLRYFNVFGPKQSPESKYAAVVPLFMRAALQAASRSRSTATASSRATSPTSTTSCRRTGSSLTTPGRRRRGVQRRLRRAPLAARHRQHHSAACSAASCARHHVAPAPRRRPPHPGVDRPHPSAARLPPAGRLRGRHAAHLRLVQAAVEAAAESPSRQRPPMSDVALADVRRRAATASGLVPRAELTPRSFAVRVAASPSTRIRVSVLVNKHTRVLTQGITGSTGQFHTKACKRIRHADGGRGDAGQGRHRLRGHPDLRHRRPGGRGDRRQRLGDLRAAAVRGRRDHGGGRRRRAARSSASPRAFRCST